MWVAALNGADMLLGHEVTAQNLAPAEGNGRLALHAHGVLGHLNSDRSDRCDRSDRSGARKPVRPRHFAKAQTRPSS